MVIRALDLPTPGRTQEPEQTEKEIDPADVRRLIEALGGPDNIRTVDNCFTRLRVTVKDTSLLDTAALLSMPTRALCRRGSACSWSAAYRRRRPGGCWMNSSNSARRSELLPFFGRM